MCNCFNNCLLIKFLKVFLSTKHSPPSYGFATCLFVIFWTVVQTKQDQWRCHLDSGKLWWTVLLIDNCWSRAAMAGVWPSWPLTNTQTKQAGMISTHNIEQKSTKRLPDVQQTETPEIEGPNPSRRERKRMKGKRGLEGRTSCRAHGQVRGKLELFWNRAERRIYPGRGSSSPTVPRQKAEGGGGGKSVKTLTP